MKIESLIVPVKGIGRRDYSKAIEFASQATARGHQARVNWALVANNIPTVPFGNAYFALLGFVNPAGILVPEAPAVPFHIYQYILSSERKALVYAGFYRFPSYADVWIWNPDAWYGDTFGYGEAKLFYSNGIKTEEGKVYAITLAEYSEQPTFDIHYLVNSLKEEVVYG